MSFHKQTGIVTSNPDIDQSKEYEGPGHSEQGDFGIKLPTFRPYSRSDKHDLQLPRHLTPQPTDLTLAS